MAELSHLLDTPGLHKLLEALVGVESRLALVTQLSPINLEEEIGRASRALIRGADFELSFRYRAIERGQLDSVAATIAAARLALADAGKRLEGAVELVLALEERVNELDLELSLVRARDSDELRRLAVRRFEFSHSELVGAREVAEQWLELRPEESDEFEFSLYPQFVDRCRKLGAASLGMKIIEEPIAGLAAIGPDALYVRPGASATPSEAERLWVHEVHGHLLPRLRARSDNALRRLGTAGCAEDDEGWAVFLENDAQLLSNRRKAHLAERFVIADALREGGVAHAWQVASRLVGEGRSDRTVARTFCRVARGGGLAREVIYLPAFFRVTQALGNNPQWRHAFESGRASVRGCPLLSELPPR